MSIVFTTPPQRPVHVTVPQGKPGAPGPPGADGAPGPKGDPGSGVTIKGTYFGTSTPLPTSPAVGDMWIIGTPVPTASPPRPGPLPAQSGDGMVWEGTLWNNVGPIRGPVGPQGPQGTTGATGATGSQGPQGATGATGSQGTQGVQGVQGVPGTPGEQWFTQAGVPATGTGIVGDWSVNSTNGDYYEKTGAAVWTQRGSLRGVQGIQGIQGTPGEKWFTQAGAPAGGTGIIADWSLDSANGDYYEKTGASAWTLRGNLRGVQGVQGIQGVPGVPGEKWFAQVGAPAAGTGIVGDWSLNTTNGDYYEKTGASTWTQRGNLTGPPGLYMSPSPPPTSALLWADTDEEGTGGAPGGSAVFTTWSHEGWPGTSVAPGDSYYIEWDDTDVGTSPSLPPGWYLTSFGDDHIYLNYPEGIYSFFFQWYSNDYRWDAFMTVRSIYQIDFIGDAYIKSPVQPTPEAGSPTYYVSSSATLAVSGGGGADADLYVGFQRPADAPAAEAIKWSINIVRLGDLPA